MWSVKRRGGLALALLAILAVFAGGCGQGDGKQAGSDGKDSGPEAKRGQGIVERGDHDGDGKPKAAETKHDGWWCDEHGIPEAECSMCSKKVAEACKAKGDWCAKHNRARSQCFKCDPKLKEVFAAKYRARFNGKEPPPITEDD